MHVVGPPNEGGGLRSGTASLAINTITPSSTGHMSDTWQKVLIGRVVLVVQLVCQTG